MSFTLACGVSPGHYRGHRVRLRDGGGASQGYNPGVFSSANHDFCGREVSLPLYTRSCEHKTLIRHSARAAARCTRCACLKPLLEQAAASGEAAVESKTESARVVVAGAAVGVAAPAQKVARSPLPFIPIWNKG